MGHEDSRRWRLLRRHGRRRLLKGGVSAGAGLAALFALACGGSGDGDEQSGSSTAGGSTAPSSGEQPVAGGSIIGLQTRDASSLDPLASQVYTTPERIGLVYPRLLYFNREETAEFADTKATPSYITERWEQAGDGATLTFTLRKGVKYSNTAPVNGRELTSNDVKFSIDRYMTDPTSAFKSRYADIDRVETPDPSTVVLTLKQPSAYVMYALAAEPSFITPPEIGQQEGDYKQTLIGPGPFLHERTTQGEGSGFRKNPDFVNADQIYYDRYDIKVVTDLSTRLAALRTGQADFVTGGASLAQSDWQSITRGNPNLESSEREPLGSAGLWFNTQNEKWRDPRARIAISKAIDRQELIDQVMEGDGVFSGPVPVGFGKWAHGDEQMRGFDPYKYDPAAAKQLWSSAGAPTQKLEFHIPPKQNSPQYVDMSELMAQQLKENLGIDTEFATDEYNTYINKTYNNRFPDVAFGFMILFDPLDNLLAQYYPAGPRNGPGLEDARLTAMLDDVKKTLDEGERVQKALTAQKYINEEVVSMAHMPQRRAYDVWSSKLRRWMTAVRPPGIEWTLDSWKVK